MSYSLKAYIKEIVYVRGWGKELLHSQSVNKSLSYKCIFIFYCLMIYSVEKINNQSNYIKSNGLGNNFERQVLKILANTRIGSHYKKP